MFLVHKNSSHGFPSLPSSPTKTPPPSSARPFEEALAARLRSLLPLPQSPPSIALSWVSRAVHLLALTLSDAAALLPDSSSPSPSDRDALAAYLDSGVALLDACNAVSAEIDRLRRRRLHLRLALRFLSSSAGGRNPETLRRARDAVAEWRTSPRRAIINPAGGDLVRSLAPADPPRGKLSAVRRAIYAVEAVSSLVAGAVVAVLGGGDFAVAGVSADFPWADEYDKVAAAVTRKLVGGWSAAELEAAEATVKKLADVMEGIGSSNGGGEEEAAERLREAAEETEKATEQLTDGLDRLSNAVNELFHSALGLRNTALQGFRVGPQRSK